jgi:hypothetical protein
MILDTKVSYFKGTKQTEVEDSVNIGLILQRIKNGTYKETIEAYRKGNGEKTNLPTVAMHGLFKNYRKKSDFYEASGLIILDFDDVEIDEIEDAKSFIMEESDSVLAAMVSPSGNGIKALYYVNPDLINADNYSAIGKEVSKQFSDYGHVDHLSVTDCLVMTYDPNILINEECEPSFILIKDTIKKQVDLEPLDKSLVLFEDAEDFFEVVLLDDILSKTNNNYHFIQVAVLDLAKYGFYSPEHDLSFIVDHSESYFKSSSSNSQRLDDIALLAKENYPQQLWPYDTREAIEDEEPFDYSEYTQTEEPDDEVEPDGIIDYSHFFKRVILKIKEGDRVGYEVALKELADIIRFKGTGIFTITGIPGHGKTEFLDAILLDLARLHKQQSIIAGFEQEPEEHVVKIMRKLLGVDIRCDSYLLEANMDEVDKAYNFTTDHFRHIDTTKIGGSVDNILESAAKEIKAQRDKGNDTKYVVIDPYNMLSLKGRYSGHEKAEEILRRVTHFSHQMEVLVFLIAHPFKMKKDEKTKEYEVPDFYSVKGSSAFFEMSYHGMVVYRSPDRVMVRILKVKQNSLGERGGEAFFKYDKPSGRYYPIDEEGNELAGDHRQKNWLEIALKN